MAEYVVYHFELEERYMVSSGYENYDQHKKEHDDFIKIVTRFKILFDKGENVVKDLHNFLCYFFMKHIRSEDQKYTDSVQKILNAKNKKKKLFRWKD
jgi:hemerythrin